MKQLAVAIAQMVTKRTKDAILFRITTALENIALAQFADGDMAGAQATLHLAQTIATDNMTHEYITFSSLSIASDHAYDRGDDDEAGRLRPSIDNNTGSDRYNALHNIVITQGKIGDIAGAKQTLKAVWITADKIDDPRTKALALSKTIVLQLKLGDIAGAEKTFERVFIIVDQFDHDIHRKFAFHYYLIDTMTHLVQAQIKNDNIAGARALFNKTLMFANKLSSNKYELTEDAVYKIAAVQGKVGDRAGMMATVDQIVADYTANKASVLSHIAIRQVNADDIKEALATLREAQIIADTDKNSQTDKNIGEAFRHIAIKQAKAGDIKEALATLRQTNINSANLLATALRYIAIAQYRSGDMVGFKESLDQAVIADDNEDTDTHYSYDYNEIVFNKIKDIAYEQINAGNIDGLATLKKAGYNIPPADMADAMLKIVKTKIKAGDIDTAKAFLKQALATTDKITTHEPRDSKYFIGDSIEAKHDRVNALLTIAEHLAEISQ